MSLLHEVALLPPALRQHPPVRFLLFSLALLWTAACGGSGGDGELVPRPGLQYGAMPNLQGREVMVAPFQVRLGVPSEVQPEAELAFALRQRAGEVRWFLPDTLRAITGRNPGIDIALERLPVTSFLQAQVERVGDPLYGHLRRLNALTGVPLVLIPVRLRYRSRTQVVDDRVLEPAMEITATLVHVRSGRVLWYGIVDGAPGEPNDPRTLASAVDALARVVGR